MADRQERGPPTINYIKVNCHLCHTSGGIDYYEDAKRKYRQCEICDLVYVPNEYYLSRDEEKAVYDLHQNSPDDPEYRRFLSRLFKPLLDRIKPKSRGLDFGSGPGPTLSVMFKEADHEMAIYDPFYARDDSVWDEKYDFITATEVVEHLHHPGEVLDRLWSGLKLGGILGLMTKLVVHREVFADWHYKMDPTHVSFFSVNTFTWLGKHWHTKAEFVDNDIILLRKK